MVNFDLMAAAMAANVIDRMRLYKHKVNNTMHKNQVGFWSTNNGTRAKVLAVLPDGTSNGILYLPQNRLALWDRNGALTVLSGEGPTISQGLSALYHLASFYGENPAPVWKLVKRYKPVWKEEECFREASRLFDTAELAMACQPDRSATVVGYVEVNVMEDQNIVRTVK